MKKNDLDTPVAVVDLDKMGHNIAEMAQVMREAGVQLRPHTKTHKSPAIAHRQLKAGAIGITVAKMGEAEVMAAAGIEDIFIAYPIIGTQKLERLSRLNRTTRLRAAVESLEGAQAMSDFFSRRGERLDVLIKVDTGLKRTGVPPGEPTLAFAQALSKLPGLCLLGIYTHEGHAGRAGDVERSVRDVASQMTETASLLRQQGFEIQEVSLGSTPTARIACRMPGVTEERPGTYVFYDGHCVARNVVPPDRCAYTILCTVISAPEPNRAVIDGGTKAFSSAQNPKLSGMGIVQAREDVIFQWANEEHGVLDLSKCPGALKVGDRIEVIPVHVCESVNLWDELVGVRGEEVEVIWPVSARGKLR